MMNPPTKYRLDHITHHAQPLSVGLRAARYRLPGKGPHSEAVPEQFGLHLKGMSYWWIRNSWGEYWGTSNYFRLEMGQNQLGIESNACTWAVPKIPQQLENPRYTAGWWKNL